MMRCAITLFLVLLLQWPAQAQWARYCLYGTVTMQNGQKYSGQLRWKGQEAAWSDIFDGTKAELQFKNEINVQSLLSAGDNEKSPLDLGFMNLWENRDPHAKFAFKCYFGHIRRIDVVDRKYAVLHLKNNRSVKLKKGSGDVGQDIEVYTGDGRKHLEWEDIKNIVFGAAPRSAVDFLGYPVYGKILTTAGELEGYVVWDRDEEAFSNDIINGRHNDKDYRIKFGDVLKLKPGQDGSLLTLKSGKELFLRGTSDVNDDNDDIVVKTREQGSIKVDWNDLIHAEFTKPAFRMAEYDDFKPLTNLAGKVETQSGHVYRGRLIYDLDESWNGEMLDGRSGGIKYMVPFYLIKSVAPQNYNYCLVTLRNGEEKLLGDEWDTSHKNNGVLVWLTNDKTKYIPWKEVKEITIDD
jgi:hypothetical protein